MYRVVLIDDERLIVEGLKKVVKWADYRCEVVATASDAVSGAAAIRKFQPHILFTDIRMPGDDGLTMLAGLKSEYPDMQVIVLTGYRDFQYAQEAIRLGVTRFLLKPSKMADINEALRAVTERLDKAVPAESDEQREHSGSFLVRQATAYIENHYAEKLTLQDVADACFVSQWHLSKLLIDAAKRLLRDPSLKIGEIGEKVGYADTAHFARVFKKLTGMSANEYRNTL